MLCWWLAPWWLVFQEPEIRVDERMRVGFVVLDVAAFDRRGRPVTDLEPSDFVVTDGGTKVDIVFFDTRDFQNRDDAAMGEVPAEYPGLAERKPLRQLVIAMDLGHISLIDGKRSFFHLRRLLEGLEAERGYLINLYDTRRGSLTHGFTSDHAAAVSALEIRERAFFAAFSEKTRPSSDGAMLLGDGGLFDDSRPNPDRSLVSREMYDIEDLEEELGSCGGMASCVIQVLEIFLREKFYNTLGVLADLEKLAYDFQDSSELKTLLLVSPGFAVAHFESIMELGRLLLDNQASRIENLFDLERRELEAEFRKLIHACTKNRIIFHTFDIYNAGLNFDRGFHISSPGPAHRAITRIYRHYMMDIGQGLASLAKESGGSFIQGKDLNFFGQKILKRDAFYYVLGYHGPRTGESGRYRKIKVKTKRKGVKLKHRTGYFGG